MLLEAAFSGDLASVSPSVTPTSGRPGPWLRWGRMDKAREIGECQARNSSPGLKRHSGAIEMPFPRASQALSRFTVLDLTRVRSGPTCVRQLADWGANVIK